MGKRKDVQDQADDAVPAAGESTPTPPEAASEVQAASAERRRPKPSRSGR